MWPSMHFYIINRKLSRRAIREQVVRWLSIAWVAFLLASVSSANAGEIRRETIASAALARDMQFLVYVPDSYKSGTRHYPVLLLLHGAGDDETAWIEHGKIGEIADHLISSGVIPPTLIVMPGCRGCWWIDGNRDKAESALWKDLLPAIARRYRTIESRSGLVVAGLSAGGYGAVRFALNYPDRLAAVAAISPAIYATTPPSGSAARTQPAFRGVDGRFSQAAWTAANYPRLQDRYFAQGIRVPFYLVSGDGDRLGIAYEAALLFKSLFEHQPDITELRIVDGGHNWAMWKKALQDSMTYLFRFASPPQDGIQKLKVAAPTIAARN